MPHPGAAGNPPRPSIFCKVDRKNNAPKFPLGDNERFHLHLVTKLNYFFVAMCQNLKKAVMHIYFSQISLGLSYSNSSCM